MCRAGNRGRRGQTPGLPGSYLRRAAANPIVVGEKGGRQRVVFGTVTGLLDRRFVLGLLLPVLAFWAGVGALAATAYGWSRTNSWWQHLDTSRHVALTLAAVAGLVFAAIVLSTQVVPMTRILEGYWSWSWIDKTAGRFGRYRQGRHRVRLYRDKSPMGYLRDYLAFAPAELGPLMPTRLGKHAPCRGVLPGR